MQEIKFRAWDLERKIMMSGNRENKDNGLFSIRSDGMIPESYILMQFTGIKDKNGTEIYNDDILQYMDGNIHAGGYKEIGGGNYIMQWHIYKYKLLRIDTARNVQSTKGIGMIHQRPSDWEVIGNIHESPELLGKVGRAKL